MRTVRLPVLIVASVAAALLLAACGGGSNDSSQITDMIQKSATSTNPADCTKYATQQFLDQTQLTSGSDAVQQCQKDATDTTDKPSSVDVSNVNVSGSTATANVTFHGGSFDGSTLSVSLIKSGDQWKLDKITGIPTFNFQGLVSALQTKLSSDSSIPAPVTSCIVQKFSQVGADQVKSIILSGNGDQLTVLFSTCAPSG